MSEGLKWIEPGWLRREPPRPLLRKRMVQVGLKNRRPWQNRRASPSFFVELNSNSTKNEDQTFFSLQLSGVFNLLSQTRTIRYQGGALELEGAVVTGDAAYCQKEIARTIHDAKGNYVLVLKANHRHLYR